MSESNRSLGRTLAVLVVYVALIVVAAAFAA